MKEIKINNYLDSTYLATSEQVGISDSETMEIVTLRINEAINSEFACIMIRPEFVSIAKKLITTSHSNLKIGTVIDFPLGESGTEQKVLEASNAIKNGVHDIDFVCDYNAFKRGNYHKFDNDIIQGTDIGIRSKRIVKWIIETGALSKQEIRTISERISKLVQDYFPKKSNDIFIKTSTGYYGGYGAKVRDIKMIKSVSGNLQIKASGGISTLSDCLKMIEAGATRIGTSKAQLIYNES